MKLISGVRIEGFRSIRSARIGSLGDFTALVGLNNSGKSNALRALSAFFTGETDPGSPLDVDHDYFRPDLKKQKKAKRIRVAVTFTLPGSFRFRKDLQHVQTFLGTAPFTITKEWRRQELAPRYFLGGTGPLNLEDRHRIDQFLQLIKFRYVPNRVLPVEVIRDEHRSLRDVLVRNLKTRAKGHEKAFEAIAETSKAMVRALADRLKAVYPDAEVRLDTPSSWSDMAFAFGYLLRSGDVEIEDSLQGAGIQSLLMLETLLLIDKDYYRKFGWRQAAVWAVEEPEASLHSRLEAQVARFFQSVVVNPNARLQILATTHSDLVVQHADKGFFVSSGVSGSQFEECSSIREILEKSARAGISTYFPQLGEGV